MAKINPNLLPAPSAPRIEKVAVPVPGQGEFVMFLRRPEFSEGLKILEETQAKTAEFEKSGNWYPCVPPVQPSALLWSVVVPALMLQVAEDGSELPPDDKYVEQELVPIAGRVQAVYEALAIALDSFGGEAAESLGNG